ncbi:MAG TPA: hypothetical protein VMU16_05565 [Candidatus Binataceae bacterium]|nr:hypothetical protein [Candidatus Binataceae bacterium]
MKRSNDAGTGLKKGGLRKAVRHFSNALYGSKECGKPYTEYLRGIATFVQIRSLPVGVELWR